MTPTPPLLSVRDLTVAFRVRGEDAPVVRDLSFDLHEGETLGIVGESGCGKSMTALALMGLVPNPPGRIASGSIRLGDEELVAAAEARLRRVRGARISMVFQEPMTSLNPVFTVGEQIAETARAHLGLSAREARDRAVEMLRLVGIPAPERRVGDYPHQLSGGMRQRVMIAIALVCEPQVLIADEPTTALDVTVQAQIFDLFRELQDRMNTAVILITHDIGVVAEMTDRVMVMYAGRKVEEGPAADFVAAPRHPYARGLVNCVPRLVADPPDVPEPLFEIPGLVPGAEALARPGCAFAPRCPRAMPVCGREFPPVTASPGGRSVACWLDAEGAR
ncbi:ABC transporter ATP-binding protein [Albimonas donghaensis]|nr:ABC transporter ATP-binding protein [Albimonas donghaensis]